MKALSLITVFFLWALVATVPAIAAPDMQEGKWEITTKMEMEGMPFDMPPVVNTQCMTKDNMVPNKSRPNQQECKIVNSSQKGNTVSWIMQCPDSNIKGEITYHGTSMEGTMQIETKNGPKMTSSVSGRRIGACN